ncbi:MAG: hypothetical protein HXY38_03965 [Chloroflexi bacterium]|nr:hypothetical protein [Chloroflexota bacterium]
MTQRQRPQRNCNLAFQEALCQTGIILRMDFFFPEDNLTRAVPAETGITLLSAEAWPDGRRLRVNLEMTPFQKRPHLEITLTNGEDNEVASTSIVEPLTWKIEFTMHIRGELRNPYTVHARLHYPEEGLSTEAQPFTLTVVPADLQNEQT